MKLSVVLTPAQVDLAKHLAEYWIDTARDLNIRQSRYNHTPDKVHQNYVGALGEVGFRVITGRRLPTVEELASTWHGPDCDGYALKTVSRPWYKLLFDDDDIKPETVHALVLLCAQGDRVDILKQIQKSRALEVRYWGARLPRPCWCVDQCRMQDVQGVL